MCKKLIWGCFWSSSTFYTLVLLPILDVLDVNPPWQFHFTDDFTRCGSFQADIINQWKFGKKRNESTSWWWMLADWGHCEVWSFLFWHHKVQTRHQNWQKTIHWCWFHLSNKNQHFNPYYLAFLQLLTWCERFLWWAWSDHNNFVISLSFTSLAELNFKMWHRIHQEISKIIFSDRDCTMQRLKSLAKIFKTMYFSLPYIC